MISQFSEIPSMPYAERLNVIHRLRLLRNTTGELSAHTGIQLRNNSFSKKTPFIARCIYSEFGREVQERTGADLDELMRDYDAASRYFRTIAKTRRAQPEFYREVLRCLFDEEFALSDGAKPYRVSTQAISGLNIAVLTLLVLDILPSFQAKDGDVDLNMHLEYLARLREYFRVLYNNSRILQFAPYLTEHYQKAVQQIHNGELFTRLNLIAFTQGILANLENNYKPEILLQTNQYVNRQKIHPALEHDIWVERNACGGIPVYWQFETLGLDYILIRREFDQIIKRVVETRYEVFLFQNESEVSFILMCQSEIERLCMGNPISEQAYMYGACNFDNLQIPQSIEWLFTTNRYNDFPTAMIRLVESDGYNNLIESVVSEGWAFVCTTGSYEYLPVERVITTFYIYVEYESIEKETGEREIVAWYRIPRKGLLEEVDIITPIAHILHDQHTYICFIPMNQSFDVTDSKTRSAYGIEIVERIDVIIPTGEVITE